MSPAVLVLGGTAEAVEIAAALEARRPGLALSSLAGRTSSPRLPPGRTRVGGFGGARGLAAFLRAEGVAAVVDATHPFAATISASAVDACAAAEVPRVAIARPPWRPVAGDAWHRVPNASAAAALAASLGRRVFLTIGGRDLAPFFALPGPRYLVRAIEPPAGPLPADCELLLARGPFSLDAELALMASRGIDVLVTKDSGGDATAPKLAAARTLGIPVAIVDRPPPPAGDVVADAAGAMRWLEARFAGVARSHSHGRRDP